MQNGLLLRELTEETVGAALVTGGRLSWCHLELSAPIRVRSA
jgi:hypothetical protein